MRHHHLSSLLLLTGILSSTPAFALVGSTPTTAFSMIGQIIGGVDGVLVAPNWVLTAGHAATTGKVFSSGQGEAMIDAKFVLPDYRFPRNDLALLHLASPILSDHYTPLNLTYIEASNLDQYDTVTLANASGNGQGRYVETTLINSLARAGGQIVHWVITDTSSAGNAIVQGGDSGSGLFLGSYDTEDPVLGGIASAICQTNKSCYVQPAAYHDWLDITMMKYVPSNPDEVVWQKLNWIETSSPNPALLQDMAVNTISPVPEPDSFQLLAIGLLFLPRLINNQRRRELQTTVNFAKLSQI